MKTHRLANILGVAALTAFATQSAEATFHLFDIQEIYTNASGTVQFIELFTTAGGQQSLGGHTITFELNGVTNQTLNLSALPSDTTNKTFLVGTANLATLYGVTPDFVIAANFFSQGSNNFINFAENTDRVNLNNLPTNGTSSLNGVIADSTATSTTVNTTATPRNFAGQTATIPEPSIATLALLTAGFALRRKRL